MSSGHYCDGCAQAYYKCVCGKTNEPIKELIKQATSIEYGVDNGFDMVIFDKEKFAKLIIRAYGNIVLHYTDVDEGVKVANKHFGVGE